MKYFFAALLIISAILLLLSCTKPPRSLIHTRRETCEVSWRYRAFDLESKIRDARNAESTEYFYDAQTGTKVYIHKKVDSQSVVKRIKEASKFQSTAQQWMQDCESGKIQPDIIMSEAPLN